MKRPTPKNCAGSYGRVKYRRWRRPVSPLRATNMIASVTSGSAPWRLKSWPTRRRDDAGHRDLFTQQSGYATPKLGVRGAVFRDARILLVRETADQHRWTLPENGRCRRSPRRGGCPGVHRGGWDRGSRLTSSPLCRDRARHPHGVVEPFHVWRLFFLCEYIGGDLQTGPETSEVALFAEHELPTELSTRRVLLPQLQRMFEHMRRPELPTEFD